MASDQTSASTLDEKNHHDYSQLSVFCSPRNGQLCNRFICTKLPFTFARETLLTMHSNHPLANLLSLALPLIIVSVSGLQAAPLAGTRPNIILILTDDMGYGEPGFTGGNPQLTPNIDRLASQGLQLTQFYTHSVCAPTRGALLTGRYAFRNWMDWRSEDFGKPTYLKRLGLSLATNQAGETTRRIHALDTNERTVAEALQEAGYFTALIGKWHCGEWLKEHLPMQQGFNHQYGHYAWGIDYNKFMIPHNAPVPFVVYDWHRNEQPLQETGYSTDLIAAETERVIAQQTTQQPFFIYVPFNAVHGPIDVVPRHTERFTAREAALKCLDEAVGRIVGAIDRHGFTDNTLVIFTNDNGGLTEESNRPFRGTKNTTYEGGVRVPCVMRWPGKLAAAEKNNGMMHVTDFFPTFVRLAAGSLQQPIPIDGIDMTEMLANQTPSPRTEIIYEVRGSVRIPTLRQGNFKLMGDRLYNIVSDPSEQTNVAKQHPELVERMKLRLKEAGQERPPLGDKPLLMSPALPYVYGQQENDTPPEWLIQQVKRVRSTQPKAWPAGETPWPQAPQAPSK